MKDPWHFVKGKGGRDQLATRDFFGEGKSGFSCVFSLHALVSNPDFFPHILGHGMCVLG